MRQHCLGSSVQPVQLLTGPSRMSHWEVTSDRAWNTKQPPFCGQRCLSDTGVVWNMRAQCYPLTFYSNGFICPVKFLQQEDWTQHTNFLLQYESSKFPSFILWLCRQNYRAWNRHNHLLPMLCRVPPCKAPLNHRRLILQLRRHCLSRSSYCLFWGWVRGGAWCY